jgi:hypothetical protein
VILPDGPWNPFHFYAAGPAVNASRGIDEEYGDAPQWHVLKPSRSQAVIARTSKTTLGADRSTTLTSFKVYFNDKRTIVFY